MAAFMLLVLTWAAAAQAEIAVQISSGAGRGVLQTDQTNVVQATPTQLALQYQPEFLPMLPMSIAALIEHHAVNGQIKDTSYKGSNLLFGGGLGLNLFTLGRGTLRADAGIYPQSQLSLQSETNATVNGQSYKHATLNKYSGTTAQELDLSLLVDIKTGKSRKSQRGRWGVTGSYLNQTFNKVETYVATSNRVLAPNSYKHNTSEAKYQLLAVRLLIAFVF